MKVAGTIFEHGKRAAAWWCIGAIGIISLLPADEVAPIRTSLGGPLEHLLAYAAASMVTAQAYVDHRRFKIAACLVLYATGLEFLQRYAHGRFSSFKDLAFSAGGVVLGLAAFHLLQHLRARHGISKRSRYANEDLNSSS
jgi:VanZ family protein